MSTLIVRMIALGGALLLGCPTVCTAQADACATVPNCVNSGVFVTDVTQVNGSWDPHHRIHFVRVNFRVRNTSTRPLILGFRWRSSASLVDNFGNAYGIDWKYRDRIVGIGIVSGEGADTSFVLQPGASRTASLVFDRRPGKGSVGDAFNADFSLEQLEPIPGNNTVRTAATHAVNFQGLRSGQLTGGGISPGAGEQASAVINGLGNLMKALKK